MTHKSIHRYLAIFILGLIIGAAGMVILIGEFMDSLLLANEHLKEQLAERDMQIKNLEANLAQPKERVVESLEIRFTDIEDPHIKLALTKQCKKLLRGTVGIQLNRIDPALVTGMVEGRNIKIDDKEYHLRVETLVITENLIITLKTDIKESSVIPMSSIIKNS